MMSNASFTFDQGVVQDKSLAFFTLCSLGASGAGLLLWVVLRRVA